MVAEQGDGIPGTYEVLICREWCDMGHPEDAMVRGHLVLESTPYPFSDVPEPAHSYLQRREPYLVIADAQNAPNACFVLDKTRGARTYGGITPVGVTRWVPDSTATVRLPLYHSPDAGYIAVLSIRGGELRGRGRSWGVGTGDGPLPQDSIIGRRIGPPNRNLCVEAAQARARAESRP